MKRIPMLAVLALLMMTGCSKDTLIEAEQDSALNESGAITLKGQQGNKPGNGVIQISFTSNSAGTSDFVPGCLPEGRNLLRLGNFNGKLNGFGKINTSLSTYAFNSCQKALIDPPNVGEPYMYAVVAEGTLALGPNDYCSITISGNIYPGYFPEYGVDGGNFIGNATTHSGVGKLKGLDNKSFEVYNALVRYGPAINLETGTIALWIYERL